VKEAVSRGEIPASRYESYLAMLYEVKDLKEWERDE
jgi:putative ribosome biogenesis GTPase RsgA